MSLSVAPPWDVPKPKKPEMALLDPELRRLLWKRAGGLDEVTGERIVGGRWDAHHRRKKSQGRDDSPSNLLVVMRLTHNRLGNREAWARERGFIVSAYGDHPRDIAILLHLRRYVLLDDAGNYIDAETGQLA